MNRSTRISMNIAAGVVGALTLLAGVAGANAEEGSGLKTLRPYDGVSIDVGSKRVIGYFVANQDTCNLTFLMSDRQTDDEVPSSSAARMKQLVAANGSARVDTAEGESLELACQPGASAMTLRLLKKVAAYKAAP